MLSELFYYVETLVLFCRYLRSKQAFNTIDRLIQSIQQFCLGHRFYPYRPLLQFFIWRDANMINILEEYIPETYQFKHQYLQNLFTEVCMVIHFVSIKMYFFKGNWMTGY